MSTVIETIAAEVGFETAVIICEVWGDRTLYIPDCPGPDHPIAQDIGYEPLLKLVAIYGGQTIRPPVMNKSHIRKRRQCLLLKSKGMSTRQIAWVMDMSVNRVKRLIEGNEANAAWHDWADESDLLARNDQIALPLQTGRGPCRKQSGTGARKRSA